MKRRVLVSAGALAGVLLLFPVPFFFPLLLPAYLAFSIWAFWSRWSLSGAMGKPSPVALWGDRFFSAALIAVAASGIVYVFRFNLLAGVFAVGLPSLARLLWRVPIATLSKVVLAVSYAMILSPESHLFGNLPAGVTLLVGERGRHPLHENEIPKGQKFEIRQILVDEERDEVYFTNTFLGKSASFALGRVPITAQGPMRSFTYRYSHGIAVDRARGRVYLTAHDTGELLVLARDDLSLLKVVPLPHRNPLDVFLDSQRDRLILTYVGTRVDILDAESLEIEQTLGGVGAETLLWGGQTRGFYAPDLDRLFTVAFQGIATLRAIEVDPLRLERRKFLALASWGVAADSGSGRLYVTDFLRGKLYELDAETLGVLRSKFFGSGLRPIEIDPDHRLFFLGSLFDPYLLVLDSEWRVKKRVWVGPHCRDIRYSSEHQKLFAGTAAGLVEVDLVSILSRSEEE